MSKWVGYAVSVNCGEPLGCYQGTILEADGSTITLTKAFRNGFPYPKSQVTLNAADIKELKIIEKAPEPAEQPHSTVAVAKSGKKGHRATVCENLQANHSSGGPAPASAPAAAPASRAAAGVSPRTKPVDIQRTNKNNTHAGSYGNSGSTPKGRGGGGAGGGAGGGGGGQERARRRNEACFGAAASPAQLDDFDFEGNLALFDKRALWEEMRAARPDLVPRGADDNFRHDENVLGAGAAAAAAAPAVRVPAALRGPAEYRTDAGAALPSVSAGARRRLWQAAERLGLGEWTRALLARAAADVCLRLAGGGRRLEARNAHQAPRVVALAGAHEAGAAALAAARLLAAHGARAAAYVSGGERGRECAEVARELAAGAGAVALAARPAELPAPDVVVLALYSAARDDAQERHGAALAWAAASRAALVALEPPPRGWERVQVRASLLALAPVALPPHCGRVYLANVAPPAALFADLHVTYRAPFGASSLLALHLADADVDD